MVEERFPPSERLLTVMHNMGIVRSSAGRPIHELAQMAKIPVEELTGIVGRLEEEGYLIGFVDASGLRQYYLTDIGILRVSSAFT